MKSKRLLAVIIALMLLFTTMTSALAVNKTAEKEAKTKPTLKVSKLPSSLESGEYIEFTVTASVPGFVTIMLTDSFGNPVVTIADNAEIHSKDNIYELPAFTTDGTSLAAGSYTLVASMTSQYGTPSDSISKEITVNVTADADATAVGTTTGLPVAGAAGTSTLYNATGTYNPIGAGTTTAYNPSAAGTATTYNPSAAGTATTYNPSAAGTATTYNPSAAGTTTAYSAAGSTTTTYDPYGSTAGTGTTSAYSAYGTTGTGTTSTYDPYGSTAASAAGTGTTSAYSAYGTTGTGTTSTYDPYGSTTASAAGTGTTSTYSPYGTTGSTTSTYDPYGSTTSSAAGTGTTAAYDPYASTGTAYDPYASASTGTTSAYGTTGTTSTYDPYGSTTASAAGTGTTSAYNPYGTTGTTSTYDPYGSTGTTSAYNPYGTTGTTTTYDPYAAAGTTYSQYGTTGTGYDPYSMYSYGTTTDPYNTGYTETAASPSPVVTYQSTGGYLTLGEEGYQIGAGVTDVYPQTDVSFWTLPDNPTDADIWAALTRPITCINADEQESTYIYDSVDKNHAKIGTVSGTSQGVNVLVTRNDGWSLVEAYRNEDGAFVRGYIKTAKLKLSDVNTLYGFVIDKRTQTLTVYMNGQRIGSCLVCTGLPTVENLNRETPAGEFRIAMRRGVTEYVGKQKGYSRYTIRINNNVYLQEIPTTKRNGSDYSMLETYLGSKQTRGTICVQARASQDGGMNAEALWNITDTNKKVKVLIIDDKTRDMIPVGIK